MQSLLLAHYYLPASGSSVRGQEGEPRESAKVQQAHQYHQQGVFADVRADQHDKFAGGP